MSYEYARFGEGYVRRASPDAEWEEVAPDDLPASFVDEELKRERRRRLGFDPEGPDEKVKFVYRAPRE